MQEVPLPVVGRRDFADARLPAWTPRRRCHPVLIIRGEHSEFFAGDTFPQVAHQYPDGSVAMSSGHNIMWENVPDLVVMIEQLGAMSEHA